MINAKRKDLIATIAIAILLLNFTSCADKPQKPQLNESNIIVSIMEKTATEMHAPGWIVGVTKSSESYEIAKGMAAINTKTPMKTSDLMRVGSITKSFTATLVLILCDEKVLTLDSTLKKYYPNFPQADKVTIRQLLKHRSGIVSWDENENIRMQIFNGEGGWTIDKLIDWASQQPYLFEPGSDFHYSNIGYFLLGKIIEKATTSTVSELLQQKISNPLKLNHTFLPETPHPEGETVHGYDESTGTVVDVTGTPAADAINFELSWTAGGILSTLKDLTVWSKAVATGELLSAEMHKEQMPVLVAPTEHNPYWSGYGMGISQTDVWVGHTGAISGYICNMAYYPEKDISLISFFNKFSAFDLDENTKDITAVSHNIYTLETYLCPETLHQNR